MTDTTQHLNRLAFLGVENPSPAMDLDLPVEYDAEGWPVYVRFAVGDVVVSRTGRMYRVRGFTLDDLVVCTEHGLDRDPAVRSVTFYPAAFEPPQPRRSYRHETGLVTLVW